MKIELKNIQCFEALSHETNAFSGSLYIDGVRVAIAENNGSGGETSYLPLDIRYPGRGRDRRTGWYRARAI